jgi:hypothetical protein
MSETINTSPQLLAELFDRMTTTGVAALRGGQELFERETYTYTVHGADCAPNAFVTSEGEIQDFQLTIRALSAEQELKAMSGVREPMTMPSLFAKASMYAVNGTTIANENHRNVLWNALGQKGRQLVTLAFGRIGAASEAALGKFLEGSSSSSSIT